MLSEEEKTAMNTNHIKKTSLGKKQRGGPSNRWKDQIRKDLDLSLLTLERIAHDRDRWKICVKENCARI